MERVSLRTGPELTCRRVLFPPLNTLDPSIGRPEHNNVWTIINRESYLVSSIENHDVVVSKVILTKIWALFGDSKISLNVTITFGKFNLQIVYLFRWNIWRVVWRTWSLPLSRNSSYQPTRPRKSFPAPLLRSESRVERDKYFGDQDSMDVLPVS